MSEKLRIGFVGAGYMGQKAHLDNFVTIPECEIVALAEGRQETAKIVAQKYNIPKIYKNHTEMLENEDLDAVVVIMYYGFHHAVVPDCLRAGKHVLTEKPICVRSDTAREMAQLADDMGVNYYVGYMKRSAPATQKAVQTVNEWKASGEFGRLSYIRSVMPPGNWTYEIEGPISAGDAPPAYDNEPLESMPDWLDAPTQDMYNAFVNFFIHQVNLLRYLSGEDYHVKWVDSSSAVLTATTDSGVPITLEMQTYGQAHEWEETYRLVFERGKIDMVISSPMARQRGGEISIFRGNDIQSTEIPVIPPRWPFLEQARHFVRCCRGEEQPWGSAWDAVKDLQVAEEYANLLAAARAK